MPAALQLTLTPNNDGTTATAQVAGAPAGDIAFWGAEDPLASDREPLEFQGSNPYLVNFRTSDLWWVWVSDLTGLIAEPEPVWLVTADAFLDEIGQTLCDTIYANRKAVEATLRRSGGPQFPAYPNLTLKEVLYGFIGQGDQSPICCVGQPSWNEEWIAAPMTKLVTYRVNIDMGVQHQQELTQLPLAVRMAGSIARILNRPIYNTMVLPYSKMQLFNCYVESGSGQDVVLGEYRYGAEGRLTWTAQSTLLMSR